MKVAALLSFCLFCKISSASWRVIKNFDLSSMGSIRSDWNIMHWAPKTVNNELQSYGDDPANFFIENGHLVIKAIRSGGLKCNRQPNRDIPGHNLKAVHGQKESSCCSLCQGHNNCKAFAWSDFQGGTCWLKDAAQPTVAKRGVNIGTFEQACARRPDHDIAGQDLFAVHSQPESACCAKCHNTANCKAYAWNSYEGGTCWLKSGAESIIPSSGVVAGVKNGGSVKITSARLQSKQRFSPVLVGSRKLRVEFEASVPTAMGAWPALWMLGKPGVYGGWPQEGEIDVMEWVWQVQNNFKTSLHWKGGNDWGSDFNQLDMSQLANQRSTFGVEVSAVAHQEYVHFYLRKQDGTEHWAPKAASSVWASSFYQCPTRTPGADRCSPLAPFDNQMELILNLAVGGDWGGCCGVTSYDAFDTGVSMHIYSVKVLEAI